MLAGVAVDMTEKADSPVVGRIVQLTEALGIPVSVVQDASPRVTRSIEQIISIRPLHHVYVYRQDGEAHMLLTTLDPYHGEHISLSDLEMVEVMQWAKKMVVDGIGLFTPADGGWFWWAK